MRKWPALIPLLWCASLFAQENQPLLFPGNYAAASWADTVAVTPGVKPGIPGAKSENHAYNLSFWSTFIPTATVILSPVGLWFGPSLGYFYGGAPGRGWLGVGIRTVGLGGMISSFAICGWDCGPGDSNYGLAWLVFGAGGVIVVADAIYDIATVKKAVRKHNRSLQKTGWMIAPVYFAKHKAGGLELQLRF